MLAFAITPGLGIALGGFLNTNLEWMSCFYASAIYGIILLFLVTTLPETLIKRDLNALKLNHLFVAYVTQLRNYRLVTGGLLMGAPVLSISLQH